MNYFTNHLNTYLGLLALKFTCEMSSIENLAERCRYERPVGFLRKTQHAKNSHCR